MDVNEQNDQILEAEPGEDGDTRFEIPKHLRKTTKFLTKYERTAALAERAVLIQQGATVEVDPMGETDSYKLAKLELLAKKMPIIIRRPLPGGYYEDWSVNELIIKKF